MSEGATGIDISVYEPKAKHAGGRPTDYNPEFCQLVEDLGKQGASKVQMAYACGVTRQTLDNWCDEHPEFFNSFTRGKDASQSWWEMAGQKGMFMTGFSASAWSRSMAARFPNDWRETKAVDHQSSDGSMSPKPAMDFTKLTPAQLDALAALGSDDPQ